MTYLNAVKYICSAPDDSKGSKVNMLALLSRLNNPQKRIKYLRLAGNNGKTVCAEMLSSILNEANYKVGYLKMPLADDPRENVVIGRACLPMEEFASYVSEIRALANNTVDGQYEPLTPTRSEILIAIALLAFRNHKCNICIIESDHFGLDPSTVLNTPFAAVICGTLPCNNAAEIARIRSYAVKGISEIVCVPQNSDARKILVDTCASINCRLVQPNEKKLTVKELGFKNTTFEYKGETYSLNLCGRFQVINAVLAIETAEMLPRNNLTVPKSAIKNGLSKLRLEAKFEVISVRPLIIVDSTHTSVAIETVCDSFADFKERTAKKVRLCLPSARLAEQYVSALTSREYTIESILLPEGEREVGETVFCKTKKTFVKKALEDLKNDTVLLISGDTPFVTPIRRELATTMGF